MKVVLFSSHGFEKQSLTLANNNKHELVFISEELNKHTLKLAEGASVVSVFVNDDCSAPILERLKEYGVEIILLRCAGYNNVDIKIADQLGISIASVPEYSPYAVAEHAATLMMALNRKIIRASNRVKDMNFTLDGLTGFDFHGKTVGIAGFGKIGQKLANIMLGMGCKVIASDLNENEEYKNKGVLFTPFKDLCNQSDIISLHLPLTPETKHLIDKESISWMKKGVMLINTGRGGLVHTKAVINALKTKKIGFLGLDVYEEEKNLFFEDHSGEIMQDDRIARLLTFPNVLITSHQAFLTSTALKNIAETTFHNLDCYLKNEDCGNFIVAKK